MKQPEPKGTIVFRIGDFSKLNQVSIVALRLYDRLGLLKPAYVEEVTGYRYYTAMQSERLNRIVALKDLGFSLDQIAPLLDAQLDLAEFEGMLKLKKAQVEQRLHAEQVRLARIEARLKLIQQENTMDDLDYKVTLRRVEARLVATIRQVIPEPLAVQTLFTPLRSYLQAQGVIRGDWIIIVHDTGFQERNLDVEAVECLEQIVPATNLVEIKELPAVDTMACANHAGTAASFLEAYRMLSHWIEANNYRITGPSRDTGFYPSADPATWYGEVQVPVEPLVNQPDSNGDSSDR